MEGFPVKLQNLVERIKVGLFAKGAQHLNEEMATVLLGKALRELNGSLQKNMHEAKAAVDSADDEQRGRQEASAAATRHLATLRQDVVDSKSAQEQADKDIKAQREAIKGVTKEQRTSEAAAKKVCDKKRRLDLAGDAFESLRTSEAAASGSKGRERVATLSHVGKEFGFHNELLSVAPRILQKRLEARRTFDKDVLQHIVREFEKNSTSLEVAARALDEAAVARKSAVQLATEHAATAKEAQKQRTKDLAAAEQAVVAGRQALVEAKRHVRGFPVRLKHMAKRLERANVQLQRFRRGPLAAYEKAFGALVMDSMPAAVLACARCDGTDGAVDAEADETDAECTHEEDQ